jgi:hypothetical protein
MRGAIPQLLQYIFMAWSLVKYSDKLTYVFELYVSTLGMIYVNTRNCVINVSQRKGTILSGMVWCKA